METRGNTGRYYVLSLCQGKLQRFLKPHLAAAAKKRADNFGCGQGRCTSPRPSDRHVLHQPGTEIRGEFVKPEPKPHRWEAAGSHHEATPF